ncbi:hypothetical protein PDIG_85340 [Penicillium digitatum PHI26]|uniref:Uncharacterized protein n=2 Tax=Penicillium digitatum TaxID=36651 RepID=K9FQQ5_PEND2|nr:hypothetical protein PDIP_22990 [Penicillium digitatum Pd1]EKV05078.1 hypothetical protein PDIG_85340 [Penicillium digitatum PHI26]EKV19564.1 hypothetical protein PDIP_22990 [Penicillium digitatum Pd1]
MSYIDISLEHGVLLNLTILLFLSVIFLAWNTLNIPINPKRMSSPRTSAGPKQPGR